MTEFYAQGDLLLERVADAPLSGIVLEAGPDGAWVLAEGEHTGHRHVVCDPIMFFRDDALARDVPAGLYIGHIRVADESAKVLHEEHAPITLPRGTYRVRRQRELDPREARIVAD
jgi:hypothetical protein